eukprot:452496_1
MNDLIGDDNYISIKLTSTYNDLDSESYLEIKFHKTKILFNTVNPFTNTTDNIIEINNNGYNNLTLTEEIFSDLYERKDFWIAFSATDDDGYGYFRFGSGTILNQNILVMIKYSVLALRLQSYESFKFLYFESNTNNSINTNVYYDCRNEEELEQFVRKFGINVFDGTDSNVDIYLYYKNDVYSCTIISPITNNKEYSCTNLLYTRNKRCSFDDFRIVTDEYDYVLSIVMNG